MKVMMKVHYGFFWSWKEWLRWKDCCQGDILFVLRMYLVVKCNINWFFMMSLFPQAWDWISKTTFLVFGLIELASPSASITVRLLRLESPGEHVEKMSTNSFRKLSLSQPYNKGLEHADDIPIMWQTAKIILNRAESAMPRRSTTMFRMFKGSQEMPKIIATEKRRAFVLRILCLLRRFFSSNCVDFVALIIRCFSLRSIPMYAFGS